MYLSPPTDKGMKQKEADSLNYDWLGQIYIIPWYSSSRDVIHSLHRKIHSNARLIITKSNFFSREIMHARAHVKMKCSCLMQTCSTKSYLVANNAVGGREIRSSCTLVVQTNKIKEKKIYSTRCSWERNAMTMNVGRQRVRSCRWPPTGEVLHVRCELCTKPYAGPGRLRVAKHAVQCRPPLLHRAVSNSERITSKQHRGSEPTKTHEEMWVLNQSPNKLNGLPICRI
jgi:uncharacterized protein YifN (PemK superfamily)